MQCKSDLHRHLLHRRQGAPSEHSRADEYLCRPVQWTNNVGGGRPGGNEDSSACSRCPFSLGGLSSSRYAVMRSPTSTSWLARHRDNNTDHVETPCRYVINYIYNRKILFRGRMFARLYVSVHNVDIVISSERAPRQR